MPNDHLPVEMPESVGTTTSMPDIHSDIQQNNASQGASGHNINRGRSGRRGPQLMWYEGEEYYEEPSDYDGPTDLVDVSIINLNEFLSEVDCQPFTDSPAPSQSPAYYHSPCGLYYYCQSQRST